MGGQKQFGEGRVVAGDGQPAEDAAAVIVGDHEGDVGQPMLPRRQQAVHVVVEGNVTQEGDDRPARGRGQAERGRDVAVDAAGAAVAIEGDGACVGPVEGVNVAHGHAVAGEDDGVGG